VFRKKIAVNPKPHSKKEEVTVIACYMQYKSPAYTVCRSFSTHWTAYFMPEWLSWEKGVGEGRAKEKAWVT